MTAGETSRERVRKAVERAFKGTWSGMKRETSAAEESPTRGPAQVEVEIRDMVEAIVRGVGAGVANLEADTKQVELVFGLKLKAGLSDVFAMLADLDSKTNVRVKVTIQHPKGAMPPASDADGLSLTAEALPASAGTGSSSAHGTGTSGDPSSDTAADTAGAS